MFACEMVSAAGVWYWLVGCGGAAAAAVCGSSRRRQGYAGTGAGGFLIFGVGWIYTVGCSAIVDPFSFVCWFGRRRCVPLAVLSCLR